MKHCPKCANAIADEAMFCPFDGTPLAPRGDPVIGSVLARRYRVVARIGAGGMATVYLARHEGLDRDVALKLLHPSIASDHRHVARFAREARAAARIAHENVVQVFDFGYTDDGFCYLAMEHVPGTTLGAVIDAGGAMPPSRAAHILAQIATGLARAHDMGIVHRDLKPDNILLSRRGSDPDFVKVLDFGLSKSIAPRDADDAPITMTGEIFGTPDYMAPEQWQSRATDGRTDIYAFGVTAFEMLTGTVPFGGGIGELMEHHLRTPAPSMRAKAPRVDIPLPFETVVARCLEKNPDARYGNIHELLAALATVWLSARRVTRHATYAGTAAAPPAASADSVPDPTSYQSGDLNVVWDGPSLCEEIGRLHAIRTRRFAELAEMLWEGQRPPEVDELLAMIKGLEDLVEQESDEVALLRASIAEAEETARQQQAHWRGELIDSSLALSVKQERMPSEVTGHAIVAPDAHEHDFEEEETVVDDVDGSTAPYTAPQLDPIEAPEDRVRYAERRMASLYRTHLREDLERREAVERHIARVSELERQLQPMHEHLSRIVQKAARGRRELRTHLVEFGKIDGALASYQALLAAIEGG